MYVSQPQRLFQVCMLRNVCTDMERPYSKESLSTCVQGWLGVVYLFPLVSGTEFDRYATVYGKTCV